MVDVVIVDVVVVIVVVVVIMFVVIEEVVVVFVITHFCEFACPQLIGLQALPQPHCKVHVAMPRIGHNMHKWFETDIM